MPRLAVGCVETVPLHLGRVAPCSCRLQPGRRLGGGTRYHDRYRATFIINDPSQTWRIAVEVGGTVVPAYFDPKYNCEMELLRFDSRRPNAKYAGLIEQLGDRLTNVAVLASDAIGISAVPVPHFGTPPSLASSVA